LNKANVIFLNNIDKAN